MADDWIKMRVNLHQDPEVLRIGELMNMSTAEVVGRLHLVWSWLDQHSRTAFVATVTLVTLDSISGVTGFTQAMVDVGWLTVSDSGASFTNYDDHISKSAKNRALTAKRQSKKRNAPIKQERDQSKSKSRVPKGTPQRRERDPIWDTIVAEFFPKLDASKIPATTRTRIGRIVRELKAFTDCTAAEIVERRRIMVGEFGEKGDTPESLAKHWSKFGAESVETDFQRAFRKAAEA